MAELKWEPLKSNPPFLPKQNWFSRGPTKEDKMWSEGTFTKRAKVPGGWLIWVTGYFDDGRYNSYGNVPQAVLPLHQSITFVPDPNHEWI